MKKLLIILLLLFVLTGCTNKKRNTVNDYVDNENYQTLIMEVGESISLNLSQYQTKYKFDEVSFNYNSAVIRVNNKEELLALNLGKSTLTATLYYKKDMVVTLLLYYVVVIDLDNPMMLPISSIEGLKAQIIQNPSGYYYLNDNITINRSYSFDPIPYFEGILINPYKYVIKGLSIFGENGSALFKELNNAYIDGLILEDVNITGNQLNSTAGLVGTAKYSYIRNVHITGKVKQGMYVGGIAGVFEYSTLVNSSFRGEVSEGNYLGGLVGELKYDSRNTKNFIKNCFVIGDVINNHNSFSHVGGLVGRAKSGFIKSSYYCGNIIANQEYYVQPIIGANSERYRIINVYYVGDLDFDYNDDLCLEATVYKITLEQLQSGEILDGLEAFTFKEGEFPFL